MSFMQPEIIECDYVRYVDRYSEEYVIPVEYFDEDCGELIEKGHGWLARLSAPGYLDCTEWSVYETERKAVADLLGMYGSQDGEPEDWEAEAEEFLKEGTT